jgi:RNA polymerase sigma-70 factor (ECF subfamily)
VGSEATSYSLSSLVDNVETSPIAIGRTSLHSDQLGMKAANTATRSNPAYATARSDGVAALSDEEAVRLIQKGDKEALAVLFRRHARIVRAVANRIVRNESEAEDVLQEVFLFLFRRAKLFDPSRGSARSWIVQIAYHRAIDRRRHLISRRFYDGLELDDAMKDSVASATETAFYERSIEGSLGRVTLRAIEASLSDDQKLTLHLFFFEGYTLQEIAEELGQSLGNVRHHYYRGIEKMRLEIFSAKLRPR